MTILIVLATAVLPPQYTAGRSLPRIEVVDESGRVRSIDAWRGAPIILVPMYTRCSLACPMIVAGLKRGVQDSGARADSYRVVLFSFDSRDTAADLRAFRERNHVPLGWTIATASRADARRLMESIDFRYADANGTIAHPNLAIAITPELQTAKYLFGTSFSGREIDAALAIARGGHDWIGNYGAVVLAALLLVATLSAVYLMVRI